MNILKSKIISHLIDWIYNSKTIFNPKNIILIYFIANKLKLITKIIILAYILIGQEIIKLKS